MTYLSTCLADSPSLFWLLNETSGPTATDSSGNAHPGTYTGAYTQGVTGPPGAGMGGNSAVTLNGATGSYIISGSSFPDPLTTFSCECWFKTVAAYGSGGALLMHGDLTFNVYMQNNGKLVAGLWTGSVVASGAATASSYNDGNWHYVAVTYSSAAGMILYVDSVNVSSFASSTPPSTGNSIWWVGQVNGSPLGGANASSWSLAGTVANVAVYPSTLTSAKISTHYAAATAGGAVGILPQQSKHRMPASFTRIMSRHGNAVYSR